MHKNMETPSRPLPLPRREAADIVTPTARTASGIWSLDGDRLSSVEDFDVGPAVVLVPTETVLILVVDLPLPTRAKRIAALPFAVEDRIAEPIEDVHVALGAEVAPGRFLVGIVRHDVMRRWTLRLIEAELEQAMLVPDAIGLPVPGDESWSIDIAAGRAMVRRPDASGFALPVAHLESAWRAAGSPACIAYGDAPPPALDAASAAIEAEPLAARLTIPALDLRQGMYARPRRAAHPLWRRIAIVAAIGASAHGAIAAADTIALSRIADTRETEARALVAGVAPGVAIGDDLRTAVADLVPTANATPGTFLPLMGRTSRALQSTGAPVSVRSLAFDASAGSIVIDVEAADIAGLQRVAGALTGAGLTAEAGAASVDQGRATGSFTVRAP
jgi:general secretion pathway protein L